MIDASKGKLERNGHSWRRFYTVLAQTGLRMRLYEMNIGKASEITGLPSKTIRYYEQIGLVQPQRAGNGYRDYSDDNIHCLAFVRHARGLGFNIDECRLLLSLYKDKNRASGDVKRLAMEKISQIDRKMSELDALRRTLKSLADHCHGDSRSDCPIIDGIARGTE